MHRFHIERDGQGFARTISLGQACILNLMPGNTVNEKNAERIVYLLNRVVEESGTVKKTIDKLKETT